MMQKILLTGYEKANNYDTSSSETLLQKIFYASKKYLFTNNNAKILEEINSLFQEQIWDYIIMFGQKPALKKISIEINAWNESEKLITNFPLCILEEILKKEKIPYKISTNPGTSYCNFAYFHCLKKIKEDLYPTKVIFIHIPYVNNFENIEHVSKIINEFCDILKRKEETKCQNYQK